MTTSYFWACGLCRLHGLYLDYPSEALVKATTALAFSLHDLDRIEKLVLLTRVPP